MNGGSGRRTLNRPALRERDYYPILEAELAAVGLAMAFHPYDSRRSWGGWPDYVIPTGRWLLFAELKRTGERATVEQAAWLDALRGPWRAVVLADVAEIPRLVMLAAAMKAGRLDRRGSAGLAGRLGNVKGWGEPAGGERDRPAGGSAAGRSPTRGRRRTRGTR